MKHIKQSGTFTVEQLSILETVSEVRDVIAIATDIIKNISGVSNDIKKNLDLAIKNLNQTTEYLNHIEHKADIALRFIPTDVQKKEFL